MPPLTFLDKAGVPLKVLLSADEIRARIAELGKKITEDYAERGENLVLLGVLKGSVIFLADLCREVALPCSIDFIGIASYGDQTQSSGVVQITSDVTKPIAGKDVLIVEDIIDSGLTAHYLIHNLATRQPASVKLCSLLHKPERTEVEVPIDYLGFKVPQSVSRRVRPRHRPAVPKSSLYRLRGKRMTASNHGRLPHALFEIGKAVGAHDDLAKMLRTISKLVTELVGGESCSIMLVDHSRQLLLGKASYGLTRADITVVSFEIGQGVAGWVAEHSRPAHIDDVAKDARFVELPDSDHQIRSLACVPILHQEELVGVLTVTSSMTGRFSSSDIELLHYVADIIALDMENFRLRRLSVTDNLTGVFNREYLSHQLPSALSMARRRGESLSLAMIDVDHFKRVNDEYGHDVGDGVLAEVAQRLRGSTRTEDILVRYGGEEFLVLLPRTDAEHARDVSERMRERIQSEPFLIGERPLDVRISAGVAELQLDEPPTALVRRADSALYAAKAAGRNRVEIAR